MCDCFQSMLYLVHDMGKKKIKWPGNKKVRSKQASKKFIKEQNFFPEKQAVAPSGITVYRSGPVEAGKLLHFGSEAAAKKAATGKKDTI